MKMPDFRAWLWHLVRHPLLFALLLALGVAFGFAYSYGPVHRAKNWKIEHLEKRLLEKGDRIRSLEQQLAGHSPSENTLAAHEKSQEELEGQIAELHDSLAEAREQAQKAEARASKSASEARSWKSKHAKASKNLDKARSAERKLEAKLDKAKQALAAAPKSVPSTPPAAPAEAISSGQNATTLASGLALKPGTGWQSANGELRIDVLSVGSDSVEVSGSWQTSGSAPELLRAGHEVIQTPAESEATASYRITVTDIDPFASATIRATSAAGE